MSDMLEQIRSFQQSIGVSNPVDSNSDSKESEGCRFHLW